ncbi:hypothetical protein JCM8097_001306 [Rhodosporidiobolus ruineniae]
MTTRRLVLVGLGNYTHPLTRHSVGQILLKNLAQRALADPRFRSSGSSTFQLTKSTSSGRFGKHASWTTLITLHPHAPVAGGKTDSVELLFVLPKQLMNVSGPTAVAACHDFLPPIARARTPPPPPREATPPPPSAPSADLSSSSTPSPASGPPPSRPKRTKPPPPPPKPMYRLLALADDLDSPPSSLKYQRGGGPKGHNGIRSLSAALPGGSRDFHRLWVGIGRPEERSEVARWVLAPLGREEFRRVEFDDDSGSGGETLEKAWEEILRVAYEDE